MKFKVGDRVRVSKEVTNIQLYGRFLKLEDEGVIKEIYDDYHENESSDSLFVSVFFDSYPTYLWFISSWYLELVTKKYHSHCLTDIFKS